MTSTNSCRGRGVKRALCDDAPVTVRYRHGGEVCRTSPRGVAHALKKLLQDAGVPPWERNRIPLIYVGEHLAAVAGYWVCAPCQANENEAGISFEWRRAAERP